MSVPDRAFQIQNPTRRKFTQKQRTQDGNQQTLLPGNAPTYADAKAWVAEEQKERKKNRAKLSGVVKKMPKELQDEILLAAVLDSSPIDTEAIKQLHPSKRSAAYKSRIRDWKKQVAQMATRQRISMLIDAVEHSEWLEKYMESIQLSIAMNGHQNYITSHSSGHLIQSTPLPPKPVQHSHQTYSNTISSTGHFSQQIPNSTPTQHFHLNTAPPAPTTALHHMQPSGRKRPRTTMEQKRPQRRMPMYRILPPKSHMIRNPPNPSARHHYLPHGSASRYTQPTMHPPRTSSASGGLRRFSPPPPHYPQHLRTIPPRTGPPLHHSAPPYGSSVSNRTAPVPSATPRHLNIRQVLPPHEPPKPPILITSQEKKRSDQPQKSYENTQKLVLRALQGLGNKLGNKAIYHYILGLQFLRVQNFTSAQYSLLTALKMYNPKPCAGETYKTMLTSKVKNALAVALVNVVDVIQQQGGLPLEGLSQARQCLLAIAKLYPRRPDVWSNLGRLVFFTGDAMSEHRPEVPFDTFNNIDRLDARPGAGGSLAIPVFEKICEALPEFSDVWNNLAVAYFLQNQLQPATECFRKALSRPNGSDTDLEPYHETLNNYGALLIVKKQYSAAISLLGSLLRKNENQPHVWNNLAIAYLHENHRIGRQTATEEQLSNLELKSFECLQQGQEQKYGTTWSVNFNLANSMIQKADKLQYNEKFREELYRAARVLLLALLDKDNTHYAWTALGKACVGQMTCCPEDKKSEAADLQKQAKKSFEAAIKLEPTNIHAWNQLAMLAFSERNFPQAEEYLMSVLSHHPQSVPILCNLGIALQVNHNVEAAEVVFKRAVKIDPDAYQVHNNLGNLYRQSAVAVATMSGREERLELAGKSYQKCIEINPRYAICYSNYALLQITCHNFEKANELLTKALEINPSLDCALSNRLKLRIYMHGQLE